MPHEQLMTSPWISGDDQGPDCELLLRPHGVEQQYAGGALLFAQGEPCPGLFVVLEGAVKLSVLSGDGAERQLLVLEPGSLVGEASTLDGGASQTTATALGDTLVLFVDQLTVRAQAARDAQLAFALAMALARKLRATVKQVTDKSMRSVPDQVACLLHQFCRQKGPDQAGAGQVTLPLSHQELADSLGVSRVAISQALSALKERGLLETGHRAIYVHDPAQLRCCGEAPFCVARRE